MPKIDIEAVPERRGSSSYPTEHRPLVEGRIQRALGDAAGLTQFGVNLVTLEPGAASALRHWHTREDEFAWVLDGELVLIEDDGETPLQAGDALGWKAGTPNGHHLVNRSDRPARFLVVGTRAGRDTCSYADVDRVTERDGDEVWFTRRDGTRLP